VARAGGTGVDVFFVLSSYLITELLLRELQTLGTLRVSAFYLRRILRIWPLYYSFLALVTFVIPRYGLPPLYLLPFALFVGNWAVADHGYPSSPAAPLWSVSIEEQFYLAWPLLLITVRQARLKWLCIVLLTVSICARFYLVANHVVHPAIWCNTIARLDPIVLGAMTAIGLNGRLPAFTRPLRIGLLVSGIASILIVVRYCGFDGPGSLLLYPAVAVGSTFILLSFLGLETTCQRTSSIFAYLGRITYGLYVFHLLVLRLGSEFLRMVPLVPRVLVLFLVNVVVAAASYKFLERPFLRLKSRLSLPAVSRSQVVAP